MNMEIWRDIDGYDGRYKCSNFGRIKSMPISWVCGKYKSKRFKDETIMKLSIDSNGYNQVELSKNGDTKKILVHRIVAECFLENKENKPCVNHINSIRTDNRDLNLEWCTQKENINHCMKKNRRADIKGEKHHRSKLTLSNVLEIRRLSGTLNNREISEIFNVHKRTICAIVNKKIWGHI